MTTICPTIKFAHFSKFYCHAISHEKQPFWTIFPQFSSLPDPLQNANFIDIVVSASLINLNLIPFVPHLVARVIRENHSRERPKRDDDNWESHLVGHQMLHLKPLFYFKIQKRDNTRGI